MAKKRKWWPDSILGRFVVGLVLAWFALIVVVSVLAIVASQSISVSSSGSSGRVKTETTKSLLP